MVDNPYKLPLPLPPVVPPVVPPPLLVPRDPLPDPLPQSTKPQTPTTMRIKMIRPAIIQIVLLSIYMYMNR
jgi:hypothetical protein